MRVEILFTWDEDREVEQKWEKITSRTFIFELSPDRRNRARFHKWSRSNAGDNKKSFPAVAYQIEPSLAPHSRDTAKQKYDAMLLEAVGGLTQT